jgi:hypothetical protein
MGDHVPATPLEVDLEGVTQMGGLLEETLLSPGETNGLDGAGLAECRWLGGGHRSASGLGSEPILITSGLVPAGLDPGSPPGYVDHPLENLADGSYLFFSGPIDSGWARLRITGGRWHFERFQFQLHWRLPCSVL